MSPSGFLVLDKPLGMTSREAVDRAARWFPPGTRLGHTGTLDPLATGVLVVAVGQATRLTEEVQRMEKVYRARVCLGARSDTDDAEGTITLVPVSGPPEPGLVERTLAQFVGAIDQVPPAYSAAKVAGRRAYVLARRGREVDLAPRSVQIHEIRRLQYDYPSLDLEIRCGKGTYIRSLARDIGEWLGCGAYVQALRRTRVGPFQESAAVSTDVTPEAARRALCDLSWAVADLPRRSLSTLEVQRFIMGQAIPAGGEPGEVAVFDETEEFVGIGRIDGEERLRPFKVFRLVSRRSASGG